MAELPTAPYKEQVKRWPASGRHILAHCDDSTIVVYQAYRPAIAEHALAHGQLAGPYFSLSRMSWIKPNFLWMMYRSDWGRSEGQEVVLGLRISRAFFERILAAAVPSSYVPELDPTYETWQARLSASDVRLQWDPDHDPAGQKLERRAIQLGLRGEFLRAYATSEVLEVIDRTSLVTTQREHSAREFWSRLRTPLEQVYEPLDGRAAVSVGLLPPL